MKMKMPGEETRPTKRLQTFMNIFMPIILTLIAILGTVEIGFRIYYQLIPLDVCRADSIIGTYICQPYFEYDKPIRLGYHYKPGLRLEGNWNPADPRFANGDDSAAPATRDDSFHYVLEVDQMGFPNGDVSWQETYDIVIAGDSFTIRTAPVTWIERLAETTDKEILTLGAPSWSTLNEAEAIKMFGLMKEPDWVILMFFEGNDMLNIGQYLERRASGLDWREYDMQSVSWRRRMLTPHLLRYLWGQLFAQEPAQQAQYRYPVTASTEDGEIETIFKDVHLLPLSADSETMRQSQEYAIFQETVIELDQLVSAGGGRLLLVYVPSKEHVLWSRVWDPVDVNNVLQRTVTVSLDAQTDGRLIWEPTYLTYDQFSANIRAQEQLITTFSQENDIDFLNLTPILWEESIQEGELYHFADSHWNQAGNDLVGQVIAAYIMENP